MAFVFVRAFLSVVLFVRAFCDGFGFCAHISAHGRFVHTFYDGFCFCARISGTSRFCFVHAFQVIVVLCALITMVLFLCALFR